MADTMTRPRKPMDVMLDALREIDRIYPRYDCDWLHQKPFRMAQEIAREALVELGEFVEAKNVQCYPLCEPCFICKRPLDHYRHREYREDHPERSEAKEGEG